MRRRRAGRGRILALRPGFNPNSSSIGFDVAFLLLGIPAAAVVTTVVSALLRFSARRRGRARGTEPPGAGGTPDEV